MSPEREHVSELFGETIAGICWNDNGARLCFLNTEGKPIFTVVASMIYGPNGNFLDTSEVALSVNGD